MIYSQQLPAAMKFQGSGSSAALTVVNNLAHASLPVTYPILKTEQNTFVPLSDGLGFLLKVNGQGYVAGSVRDIQDLNPAQLDMSVADLVHVDDVQRPKWVPFSLVLHMKLYCFLVNGS